MEPILKPAVLLELFRSYRFDELPLLIASALRSSDGARAVAALNIDADLRRRVDEGKLVVRHPTDMVPHTLPVGAALDRAVLFPWEVRTLLIEQGIRFEEIEERCGPELWTIGTAADSLGAQRGWYGGSINDVVRRMVEAANAGDLTIRDPHTDLPYRPSQVRASWDLVTPADVNAWLASEAVDYRWSPEMDDFTERARALLDSSPVKERTLGKRERDTLLVLIAAACGKAGLDRKGRGTAAQLERLTEGIGCPISHDTIKRALVSIPRALKDRST